MGFKILVKDALCFYEDYESEKDPWVEIEIKFNLQLYELLKEGDRIQIYNLKSGIMDKSPRYLLQANEIIYNIL